MAASSASSSIARKSAETSRDNRESPDSAI
jgi:hypothetical protein